MSDSFQSKFKRDISLSKVFIDSGFSTALIQKKGVEQEDCCSVFYINIVMGVALSVTQFVASPYITDFYEKKELIEWQGHKLFMKETPGHSKGSICILVDDKYLFSGDTIFREFPTATRMPGGSTRAYKTITEPWLESLPQDIVVYPGHTDSFVLFERYKTSY